MLAVRFPSRIVLMFLWGMILLAGGCNREIPPPACTVSGKLLINGRPAPGACVRFHVDEDFDTSNLPEATWCEDDGTFKLSLPEAGEYLVTFYWPSITVEEGEEIEGPDRLNSRFKDPRESKQKVTVQAGANQLEPIEVRAYVSNS